MKFAKIILVFLVCSIILLASNEPNENMTKIIVKKSMKIVEKSLKRALENEIRKNGLVSGANFCLLRGARIMRSVDKKLGSNIHIKRITSKPRNMLNEANDGQKKILDYIQKKKLQYKMPKMVIKEINKKHTQIYIPIMIRGLCLKCHGTIKTRDKKAYANILKNYPYDKAVGYKNNELGGAFLIDIIKLK